MSAKSLCLLEKIITYSFPILRVIIGKDFYLQLFNFEGERSLVGRHGLEQRLLEQQRFG